MIRKIVVLTPVKNEAWILPLFCKAASIWADYIVIADQGSIDRSKEIVKEFPKVTLVNNNSSDLDENYRDKLLVNKARELAGHDAILFRLDADEIITPNFNSSEWARIRESSPGSFWLFPLMQLYPGIEYYWEWTNTFGAFVDDGRDYEGHDIIHSRMLFPLEKNNAICVASEICILHYQFTDWLRMQSKHRYYQCFERINFPNKSAVDIYRTYHWMYDSSFQKRAIPKQWIEGYEARNVNIREVVVEKNYWWDDKIEEYFTEYSPEFFRHIETYKQGELLTAKGKSLLDKILMAYFSFTRELYNKHNGKKYKIVCKVDDLLRKKLHI